MFSHCQYNALFRTLRSCKADPEIKHFLDSKNVQPRQFEIQIFSDFKKMLPPVIFHFYRERPRFASPRDLFFNRERGTDFLALVGENFEKNRFLSWISATTTSIFILIEATVGSEICFPSKSSIASYSKDGSSLFNILWIYKFCTLLMFR